MVSTHIRKDLFVRAVRLGIDENLGKIMNDLLEKHLAELEKDT